MENENIHNLSDYVSDEVDNSSSVAKNGKGVRLGGSKGKKISKCWMHFDIYHTKKGKKRARCKYCGDTYACEAGQNGTTNLNTHIAKRCKRYQPSGEDPSQTVLVRQQTLEGGGSTLGVVKFNAEACRRALVEMLVLDELSFKFVENRGFRRFCRVACPKFEVPSRRTIVRDLFKLYVDEKTKLMNYFKLSKVRVCLTTDTWTSIQNINYMVVTCHFIDSEWQMQKKILSFSQITDHKGESIGKSIEQVLLEWGIDKVFTITVDNASANAIAISYVNKKLSGWQLDSTILGGKYLHVRCCAHILNLIVGDGLKDLHESVVAIRNAIKYIKSSPSRLERFKKCVEHEKLGNMGLVVLDVPTRWNSTYLMLESGLKLRRAFDRMEEDNGHYLNYFTESENGKKRMGPPSSNDWENAKVFVRFLSIFYDITLKFSASLHVTSNIYFQCWCTIYKQLTSLSIERDPLVRKMALNMKHKFDKYWGDMDTTNNLLLIGIILDPRFKMGYVAWRFETFYGVDQSQRMVVVLKEVLVKLFEFYMGSCGEVCGSSSSFSGGGGGGGGGNHSLDMEDERLLWRKKVRAEKVNVGKSELDLFLLESCEDATDDFDILGWWKINSTRFPILSMVAKDVFAIPVSTVASESAFSTGGRILDPFRSSLTPKLVEGLILTGNWLQSTCPIVEPRVVEEHAENDDNSVPMLLHYIESEVASGIDNITLIDAS